MITFTHLNGKGQAAIDGNGSIKYSVTGDDFLLQMLQLDFSKGVTTLQDFRNSGIPGKIRGHREVQEEVDLITLLKAVQKRYPEFGICFDRGENKPLNPRYTLLKWNGEYGAEAKFIVRDNWKNTQSLFTPGRCQDLFWFHSDLTRDKAVSAWDEFGEEIFDDLEPITF